MNHAPFRYDAYAHVMGRFLVLIVTAHGKRSFKFAHAEFMRPHVAVNSGGACRGKPTRHIRNEIVGVFKSNR